MSFPYPRQHLQHPARHEAMPGISAGHFLLRGHGESAV
jgi:hypothetical protein